MVVACEGGGAAVRVRGIALVLALAIGVLALGTGARGAGAPVKNPDTFVTLRAGDPETLDPDSQYDTTSYEIVFPNVYETLVEYDGSVLSRYQPILATTVPSLANGLIS